MPQVRKENSDSLEYVCPECGSTFVENAEECASCGLEFDWTEEMEYLCPECGTVVDPDQARCPGCNAKFSMHDDGEITIEYEPEKPRATDQDLLEAAIDESIVRPNGTVVRSEEEEEDVQDRGHSGTQDLDDLEGPPEAPRVDPSPEIEDVPAAEEVAGSYPRLYPGGFTLMGLVFAILALLALGFTIIMARYDTWIQNAAEESMGDNQLMLFYIGLTAFAVFIIIAVVDLLRTPKGEPVN
ncbi:MAG: double zinc ribbon domain-containing protein [Planctomycetota bacterium]|jgi:predicted RNA-binding Zn-ribbon protein involved in translation (DUF1610 family)